MQILSYKDLIVWKKSISLVKEIYRITSKLPAEERFGLTSQMRRCAVSIPSNIAEGSESRSRKAYANFLSISLGSAAELETQIEICEELNFLDKENSVKITSLLIEIKKMLNTILTKLKPNT